MSVQVQLYAVDEETREEIDDDVFRMVAGGPMASLGTALTTNITFEDEMEAMKKMDKIIIGESTHEYARKIQDTVSRGEVDQTLIDQVDVLEGVHEDEDRLTDHEDVIEFLEEHRGDIAFTVGA